MPSLATRLARLRADLALMRALRRERRALAALPPHLLLDIGLCEDAALREARRPVWSWPPARRLEPTSRRYPTDPAPEPCRPGRLENDLFTP